MKQYTIYQTLERWIEVDAENYDIAMELAYSATNDEWNGSVESEHVEAVIDGMIVDCTGGDPE